MDDDYLYEESFDDWMDYDPFGGPRMTPQGVEDKGEQQDYTVEVRWPDESELMWDARTWKSPSMQAASTPRLAVLKQAVLTEHSCAHRDRVQYSATDAQGHRTVFEILLVPEADADFRGPVIEFRQHYKLQEVEDA